ncbi:MAG: efflux RND transporter permease subunit [Verrucomicrobiae bacterium]|nr:efflux RND transporter permease subunit [Verrucomicrobiae bacterium]
MILSDISIRRPVLASVMNLLLIAFGLVSYSRLQVREYPDIEPPVITIETEYPGAAASVMERRITQIIEDRIAGVEGIENIGSISRDGVSTISVEFAVDRNVDAAANDVREAVSSLLDQFPEEVRAPEITKEDAATEVLMWLNLTSDSMPMVELADYADRYLMDRFSTLPGVARVRITGATRPAMRIWLDREKLAARNLTVLDVEEALRRQNVELPAGAVQSLDRTLTVRLKREFVSEEEFSSLILKRGSDGYLVRLGEVAQIEMGAEDARRRFHGNGVPMVGMGIVKQSRANSLAVARAAKEAAAEVRETLPEGMKLEQSYDTSLFIEASLREVYKTLAIAIVLVVLVIYLFLGSVRATIIPAVAVPVSAVATCVLLYFLDFSVNVLTLLSMVLAIGLVVDDAIVVLENIHRRMELGESALVAAYLGSRQVGFAVVATTLVLVSVFVPISFLEGDVGKLFTEFAITLAVAVSFSSFVALTWCPMLASRILRPVERDNFLTRLVDGVFRRLQGLYRGVLTRFLRYPLGAFLFVGALAGLTVWLQRTIPSEFTPMEDRGSFFVIASAPEGASYGYSLDIFDEIEKRLLYLVDTGDAQRVLVRTPRAMGAVSDFNEVIVIINLNDWGTRRSAWEVMDEVRGKLSDLRGVRTFAIMRQGLSRGLTKPFQVVVGGPTYEELAQWRDLILEKAKDYPGFVGLDYDYKETKPQLRVAIDRNRAADLGVSIANVGRTLEALMGSKRVTTYIDNGEEYDVLIEGDYESKRSPSDMENVYVRSETTDQLIPLSNLVSIEEFADSGSLNRYDRMRAITFDAGLAPGYSVSEALEYFETLVRDTLPDSAVLGYKGETLKFKESSGNVMFIFLLAIVVVYLVLSAQFESFVHPVTILLTVPIAIAGALMGLLFTGLNQSLFTQIGMIMLVGLAAKNGILIVEFINQLREEGYGYDEAIIEASTLRLRPIVMTVLTTIMGSLPLILPSGAGSETRYVVGIVILWGVGMSALFTLFVVPLVYRVVSRKTADPGATGRKLEAALNAGEAG